MSSLWRFWTRMGFKPYWFSCPGSRHDWRRVHGDEMVHVGATHLCRNCPQRTNIPDGGR